MKSSVFPLSRVKMELFDMFEDRAISAKTPLSDDVGIDILEMKPQQASDPHYHKKADALFFVLEGKGVVILDGVANDIKKNDVVVIKKKCVHGFRTNESSLKLLSVHTPPIVHGKKWDLFLPKKRKQ